MKTYNNLFEKICTFNNFYKAYRNAIKGKKHYKEVKDIERYGRIRFLKSLLYEIKNKKYKVSKYEIFERVTGGKVREIYKLPMKDRIVLHAIMIYLEPIFRENFIIDTYSSIKTRGIHLGLKRIKHALKKYDFKYCLKLDIKKCYPSIDQLILKNKLRKKFKDNDLIWLLNTIIDSCDRGIPIGNYTSLYFNNFYFSDFDHWIKEHKRIKGYFRYCDDIVILSNNKIHLHDLMLSIFNKINSLNVVLKSNWQIFPIDDRGINFLGYITRPRYIKIRKQIKKNFILKVSSINLSSITKRDANILGSYWGILKHADCRNLWLRYTHMKNFKELGIIVHERFLIKNLVGIPITVTKCSVFLKKGIDWVKILCTFSIIDQENTLIEHKDVIVGTSAEKIIEAAKLFNVNTYPFETIIKIDENGFYEFT